MNRDVLTLLAKVNGLSGSDLARLAGVSRQAVALWLKPAPAPRPETAIIDMRATHLKKLADGLGLSVDLLLKPLPSLGDRQAMRTLETSLLWDRLYPTFDDFCIALAREELRAIARLVQVYGLFQAAKTVGKAVWKKFPRYKHYLRPGRREACEKIWQLQ